MGASGRLIRLLAGQAIGEPVGGWRVASGAEPATSGAASESRPSPAAPEAIRPADRGPSVPVTLPHLDRATAENDHRTYRATFGHPGTSTEDRRWILRFGGAFYRTRVQLNGRELGEHEGYFSPFGADVTDELRDGDNQLVVTCHTPVEAGDLPGKTAILGVFADWDCKPYPSAAYPTLTPPYTWTVPVGLWRGVDLFESGPLLIEACWCRSEIEGPRWPGEPDGGRADKARLRIYVRLRNLSPTSQRFDLTAVARDAVSRTAVARTAVARDAVSRTAVARDVSPGSDGVGRDIIAGALDPGAAGTFVVDVLLDQPRLWFPWTHGEPALYRIDVSVQPRPLEPNPGTPAAVQPGNPTVDTGAAHPGDKSGDHRGDHRGDHLGDHLGDHRGSSTTLITGIRAIDASVHGDSWQWQLNGRRIFPRGSNYISDHYLDRVTSESLARDVRLAKDANLDLLRVHAHIEPRDFYAHCDAAGVLVMCDFPLQWTYAAGRSESEQAAFREEVARQARTMVEFLGPHPSIGLWSIHNEPPWTESGAFLGGELHRRRVNEATDRQAAETVRRTDPSRAVNVASGHNDEHLYHGWYTGTWPDTRDLAPIFPTEFGAQALPDLASPFWATVNTEWPIPADDPSWRHAGFQELFWASPGVGSPADYKLLEDYVEAGQGYQALLVAHTIDHWRIQKFDPVGGYAHFLLTDGWPAISWSVLDYFRLPKAGYRSLAEASAPLAAALDIRPGYTLASGHGVGFEVGDRLAIDLYLVNDDHRLSGHCRLDWWVEPAGRGLRAGLRRRFARLARRRRNRHRIPAAAGGAVHVADVRHPVRHPGQFLFRAQVRHGGRVVCDRRMPFRVGEAPERTRAARKAPWFLVRRVYEKGSLHHTEDGFAFRLRNPAMPVLLERIEALTVDGEAVAPADVELVCGGQRRRGSTVSPRSPLEVPSGETVSIVAHRRARLAPGRHEIAVTVELGAFGTVTATLRDQLL